VDLVRGLQKGQERDGGEIDGGDVGVVGGVPFFKGLAVEESLLEFLGVGAVGLGFGARDTGCDEEEVEVVFFGAEICGELFEVFFAGYVAGSNAVGLSGFAVLECRNRCWLDVRNDGTLAFWFMLFGCIF
jgi:hypothetical protein